MKKVSKKLLEEHFGLGLPEAPKSEWPEGTEEVLELFGSKARVVRRRDGGISIFKQFNESELEDELIRLDKV